MKSTQESEMPKSVIKSYEDWTPPKFLQGEDEDIDLERVKLEFYTRESENAQYRRQNRSLKQQVSDLRSQVDDNDDDDSGDSDDVDEAPKPKSKSKSEGEGQGSSLNEIRLELALEKGLTKNQVMRLRGTNREELEADAEAYMEEHGLAGNSDDEGSEGDDKSAEAPSGPPSRQPRRGDGKSGLERGDGEPTHYDPSKLMDLV